jgi:hypothetical protein
MSHGFHSSKTSGIDVVAESRVSRANSVSVQESSADSRPKKRQYSCSSDVLPRHESPAVEDGKVSSVDAAWA